jgi:hypothetical protein
VKIRWIEGRRDACLLCLNTSVSCCVPKLGTAIN